MSALITADALAGRIDDVVVLDVQWTLGGPPGSVDFERAHIPGARFLDLETALAAPPGVGGRHPLPEPDVLQRALRACGVDDDSAVVVYDGRTSMGAARAWWVLRWAGLRSVRVLDGGLAAWLAAGHDVKAGTESVPGEGSVVVRPGSLPALDAADAAALAATGVLLDARAPERFRGEVEPIDPVAGHIPGAVNAPTTLTLRADGRFRPGAELAAWFASLGARPGTQVGTTCGSGVTAAHLSLALHEAGIDSVLYPGSWSEWITDASRPVATGS